MMSAAPISTAEWARHWHECAVDVSAMAEGYLAGQWPLPAQRALLHLAAECECAAQRAERALEEAQAADER